MPKISGPTPQQTVSSSTMLMEEPVVSKNEVKTESKTETPSHSEAQKQNATARQGDNNLTAMLQRDRIAEIPRAYIPKADVDYLAKTLTSKPSSPNEPPAGDGVKESLANAFIKNGPGQHAKIAECMRQFAAAGTKERAEAYSVLKEEVRGWTSFDPTGRTQPAQRSLFKEITELRGPGAARVKADVALMIQHNIEQAEKSPITGMRAYAGIYTYELRKMLQTDTARIFRTLVFQPEIERQISGMVDNLLNHRDGRKAIAEAVAEMTANSTRLLLRNPLAHRMEGMALGLFMSHVRQGIERNMQTREEMIEKGASLAGFLFDAAEKLVPKEAKGMFFDSVKSLIDWEKKRELSDVAEIRRNLISDMNDLVNATFRSVADPDGTLAAQEGNDLAAIENYLNAWEVFVSVSRQNR